MTQNTVLRQNENGKWGLYLDYKDQHDLKNYLQHKDKITWITFHKCGIGYGKETAVKNFKKIKLFKAVESIDTGDKSGLTYGQIKEIHKIIKKRKLKQNGIIGISREEQRENNKSGMQYCCPRSPRSKYGFNRDKEYVTMYRRGTGRYKYSIIKYYIIPKFWKCPIWPRQRKYAIIADF